MPQDRGPRPPDHPPMLRLRRCGLKPDEEAAVYAAYVPLSPAEKWDALERLEYLDDEELAQQIIDDREGRVTSLVGTPPLDG